MRPAAAHIATPRLTLRPLGREDIPALVRGVGNYDVAKWLSVVPYPYCARDAEAFLASDDARAGLTWGIVDGAGLQGVIGAGAELGFWLARPVWNKGYATEAGDAVLDAWFAVPGNNEIFAGCFAGNEASARVLRKLGFRAVGQHKIRARALSQKIDSTWLILGRDDWQARRRYRLQTPRLTLREIRADDWHAVQRVGGDPRVAPHYNSGRGRWAEPDVKDWIARSLYRGRPGFRPAVCLRDGTLIGTLGLGMVSGEAITRCACLIDPDHWGRGYASEALGAFLADTMARFNIPELAADPVADNPASARVLEKLGFRRIGTGTGGLAARLEPAPNILYRLKRSDLKVTE